jgi:hypothetical protein
MTTIQNQWAPLVYARTYEVDFRLITAPDDFTQQNEDWAIQHILATTRAAEQLYNKPRWSMFMNEDHWVVGVTCMASELLQSQDLETFTSDSRNRPLYLFVGYVAQRNHLYAVPNLAVFADRQLEDMRNLYDLVRDRWRVQAYQRESQTPIYAPYQEVPTLRSQAVPNLSQEDLNYFDLNCTDPTRIRLWAESNQNSLWLAAIQQAMCNSPQPFSLCLGLVSQASAIKSPFLNATSPSVDQREDAVKPLSKAARIPEPTVESTPRNDVLMPRRRSHSASVTPEELVGAVFGSAIGGFLSSQILRAVLVTELASIAPGVVVGSAIGWLVAGYLTEQGIGGEMLKQSQTLMKRTSKSRRRRGEDAAQYGLKYRDEQKSQPSRDRDNWF